MLIDCHDPYPSTDVVYALAYRMIDPTNQYLIDYEWFKFLQNADETISTQQENLPYLQSDELSSQFIGTLLNALGVMNNTIIPSSVRVNYYHHLECMWLDCSDG